MPRLNAGSGTRRINRFRTSSFTVNQNLPKARNRRLPLGIDKRDSTSRSLGPIRSVCRLNARVRVAVAGLSATLTQTQVKNSLRGLVKKAPPKDTKWREFGALYGKSSESRLHRQRTKFHVENSLRMASRRLKIKDQERSVVEHVDARCASTP